MFKRIKEKIVMDKLSKNILRGLAIYLVIMLAIFLPKYIKLRYEKLYIISDDYRIKYENGTWKKFTDNDIKEEYVIYEDGEYKGKYLTLTLNNILLYENGSKVNYSGRIFGYRGTLKFDHDDIGYNGQIDEADKGNIDDALNILNINPTYENLSIQKELKDIDNDGNEEIVYCINNYNDDGMNNKSFSIIFIVDNDKVKIVDSSVANFEERLNIRIHYLNSFFDIRKDGKFELLYTYSYPMGSKDEECLVLYNLSGKKVIHNFCE